MLNNTETYRFNPEGVVSGIEIAHPVKAHIKEAVGIPESEPAAIMVHITTEPIGENITKIGFVNVSERGTLAPILDIPEQVNIIWSKAHNTNQRLTMITMVLPAKGLRYDRERYGWWYDNPLPPTAPKELQVIYNGIATEYDDESGEPLEFAKDNPDNYPV